MFDHWFAAQEPRVSSWLGALHAMPETGFCEEGTARFVAEQLQELGFEVATGLGGTGVVGTLDGFGGAGRTIGLRAELDALPMSGAAMSGDGATHRNRFHGCGHDGHMTIVLCAAAYLAAHREFSGTLRVIFQPAEELLSGARAMLSDGLFTHYPVDEIYALHNLPGLAPGHVAIPAGTVLASADDVDVTIRADGAHGAMPNTGQDAMLAAAAFVTGAQQAATRVLDARDAAVVSFGALWGGTARNILPAQVDLAGTLRAADDTARDRLRAALQDVGRGVAAAHGLGVDVRISAVAPRTVNHPACAGAVIDAAGRIAGAECVQTDARPLMASEDFAEMLSDVPGAYAFIGQGGAPLHHPEYRFDPALIPLGAALLADIVMARGPTLTTTRKKDDQQKLSPAGDPL